MITAVRYKKGIIDTHSGAAHMNYSVDESIDYIDEVFMDYKAYSGIEKFYGKVAEIGLNRFG